MSGGWQDPTERAPGYPGGGYGTPGEPTQAMPPARGRPPGQGGPYYEDPAARRKRLWLIAAGILAVLIIIVLVVLLLTSGGSSSGVNIDSFNVPSTASCSGPTTIGVSWSTSSANQVTLSIDGGIYKTYPGGSGADTVPFACNGLPHRYTLAAISSSGKQVTQSQTVTQISTATTTQKPPPTTSPPPPTTSPPPPTTTSTT